MTSKDLAYYLRYPERIQEVSSDQLDHWISEYPYAAALRMLRARRDLDTGSARAQESIQLAAAYSEDLVFLRYQLLRHQGDLDETQSHLAEIKPQKTVEKEPLVSKHKIKPENDKPMEGEASKENKGDEEKETPSKDVKKGVSSEDVSEEGFNRKEKAKPKIESRMESPTEKPEEKVTEMDDSKDPAHAYSGKEPTPSQEEKEGVVDKALGDFTSGLSEFSLWLLNQEKGGLSEETSEMMEELGGGKKSKKKKKKKKKKGKKKSKLQKLIDHSIVETEEIVTETYADLVADQGHIDKAIELYEKLQLKMPEKSAYFARKIQELKNS